MKLLNLVEEQFQKGGVIEEHPFFREYLEVFNFNSDFSRKVGEIIENNYLESLQKEVGILLKEIEAVVPFWEKVGFGDFPGIITYVGDGAYDGHGIIIDGKPFAFFDMAVFGERKDMLSLKPWLLHELIHPIHYQLSPQFYPRNYKTAEDRYLKKMIVEGVATHITLQFFPGKDTYWSGFLDNDGVKRWKNYCEEQRDTLGEKIEDVVKMNCQDDMLFYKLFGIVDFEKLYQSRLGYYYGERIVDQIIKNYSFRELLQMDFSFFRERIKRYFGMDY